jgi:hypothetical protein
LDTKKFGQKDSILLIIIFVTGSTRGPYIDGGRGTLFAPFQVKSIIFERIPEEL